MNCKIKKLRLVSVCGWLGLLILCLTGDGAAQAKPSKTYLQTLEKHVRLVNEQLRTASEYNKYFVKAAQYNDWTELVVHPKSALWSKANDARREEIAKDWLIRWAAKRRGYESEKAVLTLTVADGEDVFACTQQPDGTIGCS